MRIFAISDLHLALGINKPMDIFGGRWENYMDKIKENWEKTVGVDDYVLMPGDFSWATYLEQAYGDFLFLQGLPGRKILLKGNHDYWWTTLAKLNKYVSENRFDSVGFLHNNCIVLEHACICGTRGWKCPGDHEGEEDRKIYQRELQRLELSLKSMPEGDGRTRICMMHYPPFDSERETSEFVHIMARYGVDICIYGHLHGESFSRAVTGNVTGIEFMLVSADFLHFSPVLIK